MAHLGSRVSALLDGRLDAAEEDRCWSHVHECHACRDLVEREGWVKTRLAELSLGPTMAPDRLKDSLLSGVGSLTPPAFPTAPRSRARVLVVLGGGAAGACVVGVLALGVVGSPGSEPRPPVTDLSRPSGPTRPATPVEPYRSPLPELVVTVRERMDP